MPSVSHTGKQDTTKLQPSIGCECNDNVVSEACFVAATASTKQVITMMMPSRQHQHDCLHSPGKQLCTPPSTLLSSRYPCSALGMSLSPPCTSSAAERQGPASDQKVFNYLMFKAQATFATPTKITQRRVTHEGQTSLWSWPLV